MPRWGQLLAILGATILGVPLLLLAILSAVLDTQGGRHEAERLTARLTGGQVQLIGLRGDMPHAPRLDRLVLRDANGVWLTATGLRLDWSPWALLGLHARASLLGADTISLLRLPHATSTKPHPKASSDTALPIAIDIADLVIDNLALGPAAMAGADHPLSAGETVKAETTAHLRIGASVQLTRLLYGSLRLALRRTDAPGHYTLQTRMTATGIQGSLLAQEPPHGLVATATHMPELGGFGLDATLDGPWQNEVLKLALAAGPLRAAAHGSIDLRRDLPDATADLSLTVDAPAMAPAAGTSWHSVAFVGQLTGALARPRAGGTLEINGLAAAGGSATRLAATIGADTHQARLTATIQGIQLPPPNQGLLADGPLTLHASMNLDDPRKPVTGDFAQALLQGQGEGMLNPQPRGRLTVTLPDLHALARTGGRDIAGNAGFTLTAVRNAGAETRIDLDAALAVTGGADAPPAARGQTTLGATVTLAGANITVSRLDLAGNTLHASATGSRRGGQLLADWHLAAADVHDLLPTLAGAVDVAGHLAGTEDNFAVNATLAGSIGRSRNLGATPGDQAGKGGDLPPVPVSLALRATGLPHAPAGRLQGDATLAGAPLTFDITAAHDAASTLHVAIARAAWKSAQLGGTLDFPTAGAAGSLPTGVLSLAMTRLDDLSPLVGQRVTGSLTGTLDLPPSAQGHLHLLATGAGLAGRATIGRAVLEATLNQLGATPRLDARLDLQGVRAGAAVGRATMTATGPARAPALRLAASATGLAGADATLAAAATLDTASHTIALASLDAGWHAATLHLAAPARLTYAPTVGVDRLRLILAAPNTRPAALDVAGTLRPALALSATATGLTPALAGPFVPASWASMLNAEGSAHLDGRLAGSIAVPTGTITLAATGLRARTGSARGLPPMGLTATAVLGGTSARIDASLIAGATHLALRGTAPLPTGGGASPTLALEATGSADLALLDPLLTPQGRRVRGTATLQARIAGTIAAPRAIGSLDLAGGQLQDYAQGILITAIAGRVEADGDSVRLVRLTGRAGGGTLSASGSVGLVAPMPTSLHITADNARPIASDLVTATLDADITVAGNAAGGPDSGGGPGALAARGRIHVRHADIQLPDRLPASVAVLDVRNASSVAAGTIRGHPAAGDTPAVRSGALTIPLDIALDAPAQVFVRGRGLDAELGGSLHVGGSAAAPLTSGSIGLRRGSFSLAGTTLNFTSGDIGFNGAARIDPALDLVATGGNADITATLTIGGYASAPRITLSSVPDRPQDEVLAALLFGQSAASLGPLQLAQIGAAVAQLSGVGGGGPDPLSRLRKGLGLDRLSVGNAAAATGVTPGTTSGAATTTDVQAGRYVAPGIYLGARQGTSGTQTQAEVQIDITRSLKLNTDVGSGTGGNSIGLTYQFQY